MDTVRALTQDGVNEFIQFLDANFGQTRDASVKVPFHLLYDEGMSRTLTATVTIEEKKFDNRIELGLYLRDTLKPVEAETDEDKGLWSWMGLYYFNQICPVGRTIGRRYRYNFTPDYGSMTKDWNNFYRHLLYTPYDLIRKHNGKAGVALLAGPMYESGDLVEQIMSRQEYRVSSGVLKTIDMLYYDEDKQERKSGWDGASGGNINRLWKVLNQLSLNYDVPYMDPVDIMSLLPGEFDQWIQGT